MAQESTVSFALGPTLSPSPKKSGSGGIPLPQEALVGIFVGVAVLASCMIMLVHFLKVSPRARGFRNFISCSRGRNPRPLDPRERSGSEHNLWTPGNGMLHITPELLHSTLSPIPTMYDPTQPRHYPTRAADVDERGRRTGPRTDDEGNWVDEKEELPAYSRHSIGLPTYTESDAHYSSERLPPPVTHSSP
ncbi:uncharacterized protein EI90DRAFT_3115347 [Cantharellus anzutake]|uniref:uncharacterized protein n=1 Tax=Cantharellus anzutake TaxID=1750568 RepID=UPI001904A6F9|nr:uncharacterized protein EI90DRAFT_3115347 [Cantharellus anzutake]KAF8342809.1 hypothetical protein EI90DRAFT_3115347 [Cantharellus anzutake]